MKEFQFTNDCAVHPTGSLVDRAVQVNNGLEESAACGSSVVYDPGEIYSSLLGAPTAKFREAVAQNSRKWVSDVEKDKQALITSMEKIVTK